MNKRRILSFALIFALALQIFTVPSAATAQAAPKAVKTGLQKVGKKIYYYNKKGKKVTNAWKTVKGNRYYFGKNGAAYTGYKKIKKDWYYFDKNCRMVREKVEKIKGSRYYFMDNGKAPKQAVMLKNGNIWKTNSAGKLVRNITKYAKSGGSYDALRGAAGKPFKSQRMAGCNPPGSFDEMHTYDNFQVSAVEINGVKTIREVMQLAKDQPQI